MRIYTEKQVNELYKALTDISKWNDDLECVWRDKSVRAKDSLKVFNKMIPIQVPDNTEINNISLTKIPTNNENMKTVHWETMELITQELANLPHEYASKDFASEAEGIAVIREEYLELEKEVFWGRKQSANEEEWKDKMRAEAVQLAAMAIRFIQESCK